MRKVIWLIIVMVPWTTLGCQPVEESSNTMTGVVADSPDVFEDVADAKGIRVVPGGEGSGTYFFPAIMNGGAAIFDADADGLSDVLLLDSRKLEDGSEPNTLSGSALFLQNVDGQFRNATRGSGLERTGFATGCTVGDINNDGLTDLYVTAFGPDQLYLNKGQGRFQLVSDTAGVINKRWGTSAAFLDYDRDGWLDLYVANYVEYDPGHDCVDSGGRQDFCNPAVFPRTTDRLFHNVSGAAPGTDGIRFEDVTLESGIAAAQGAGLGVVAADFDGDSWIDIYVANDGHGNFLWINQKDGRFIDEAVLKGVAYDPVGQGQGSMGLAVADINLDSRPDILITNLEGESNALYQSRETGFSDVSQISGISETSFPLTGFGTVFFDAENDGDIDLAVANGRVRRGRTQRRDTQMRQKVPSNTNSAPGQTNLQPLRDYAEHGSLLLNQKGKFVPSSSPKNPLANIRGVGRSLAQGDINNDGRIDLLVTYLDRPASLLLNQTPTAGHWLSVRVIEPDLGGRDAVGAVVTVTVAGKKRTAWLAGGGSYQCSSELRLHFGLGPVDVCDSFEVIWPNGEQEQFPGVPADQQVVLKRGEGKRSDQ